MALRATKGDESPARDDSVFSYTFDQLSTVPHERTCPVTFSIQASKGLRPATGSCEWPDRATARRMPGEGSGRRVADALHKRRHQTRSTPAPRRGFARGDTGEGSSPLRGRG